MAIIDLFSKRKKRLENPPSDILSYSQLPPELRTQIIMIWKEALDEPSYQWPRTMEVYKSLVGFLRRERGVFRLVKRDLDASEELSLYFLDETETDLALDVVELVFKAIDLLTRDFNYAGRRNYNKVADDALAELNDRFKEHGIGYFYSDGSISRMDTTFTHEEIVKPALAVFRQAGFESAQAEFLSAHEHYRAGENSQVLIDCYKAFESTMKVIIDRQGWPHDPNANAAALVRLCYDHKLIPDYFQANFAGLRSILESAIPTPRNRQAGHGAGASPLHVVPDHLASYVLNMTASTLLFLSEAEKNL